MSGIHLAIGLGISSLDGRTVFAQIRVTFDLDENRTARFRAD